MFGPGCVETRLLGFDRGWRLWWDVVREKRGALPSAEVVVHLISAFLTRWQPRSAGEGVPEYLYSSRVRSERVYAQQSWRCPVISGDAMSG